MARVTFVLAALLILAVGGILLQSFLSRRESRWPGLVLPALSFLCSVVMVLNVVATNDIGAVIATILTVLLTGNISTLILLAIYFACRGRGKKRSELDKMKLEDL